LAETNRLPKVQKERNPEAIELVWLVWIVKRNHATDLAQARHLNKRQPGLTQAVTERHTGWPNTVSHYQVSLLNRIRKTPLRLNFDYKMSKKYKKSVLIFYV